MHKKLFIVDDDPSIIKVYDRTLRPMLEMTGVEVQTFGDADSLLEAVEREGMPTAVLTDDRMPAMSGRQLAANLRERGFAGKILMVSGTAADDDVRGYGIDELLPKPFDSALLRNTVRSFLG